jgi:hypothetical protein
MHLGHVETTINPRYDGLLGVGDKVSVIADVRYNRVKGCSGNYTIGTCNKHRKTECDHIRFLYWDSFLF